MSSTDKVYELIRDEIITCVLHPGQQVVQSQLAEHFQMGLTPIREALQRLCQENFVQAIPRFGYVVTPVTLADVTEIYELRTMLEAPAARLAASRASDAVLEQIARSATFTYVFKDSHSYGLFLSRNSQFHRSIAAAAGNARLADNVSKLLDQMTRIFHLGLDLKDSASEMRNEHLELGEALVQRNAALAEALVVAQIASSLDRVRASLMGEMSNSSNSIGQSLQLGPAASYYPEA
jgi:DNA-binding GntR family transcriptional regulator